MSDTPQSIPSASYAVLFVGLALAWPLWREFHEPGHNVWNGFLLLILVIIVMGPFFGVRHLHRNRIEVGEARFRQKNGENG